MSPVLQPAPQPFVDRRAAANSDTAPSIERRQFANSYTELSPAARELGLAIDQYKMQHRRRFINYEEMLTVLLELGYQKATPPAE